MGGGGIEIEPVALQFRDSTGGRWNEPVCKSADADDIPVNWRSRGVNHIRFSRTSSVGDADLRVGSELADAEGHS